MRRWTVISALLTVAVGLAGWIVSDARLVSFSEAQTSPTNSPSTLRALYAVNQRSAVRGSISVYDIDRGHRLVKTIPTVSNVDDVKGVAVSPTTGKLYVAYRTNSGVGMIYCFDVVRDVVLWNRAIKPDVDRLAISPDGRLLYVPTWEGGSSDYINVLDANSGDVVRDVRFSNRSHDSQFPLSGPLFQETKATDGSGDYLYMIDPGSYAVSRIGPYSGILGPYAVDSETRHVVNNVTGLWGMQVADIKTGQIVTAIIPEHPPQQPELLHGIGWTPDESEVWQNSNYIDPHVYVWDMSEPMVPKFKERLGLKGKHGGHWLTFDVAGDYAYIAPAKNSDEGTEIFNVRTHKSVGLIDSSEDMVEIDFVDGVITRSGDQYGIGRAADHLTASSGLPPTK
jgi:hypothetical protein